MSRRLTPVLEPLDVPMTPFAVVGTALWALAGLVLLFFRDRLADDGHTWWLWMCLAGVLGGLVGTGVMVRHDASRRDRRSAGDGTGKAPEVREAR